MSQFSTMTTRERKMQAAAICREFQAQEDIEMDIGKKMSVPKDIMLEELSLASNRGSRLFKMRQRRSEKYTFENIQNHNNKQLNNTAISENGDATDSHGSQNNVGVNQPLKLTSDTTALVPDPTSIAPGFDRVGKQFSSCLECAGLMQNMRYGCPLKDIPPEKFNNTAVPKSYHSPWEQAIINDPALADILTTRMPQLGPQHDLPGYKSFNRVATPFGGFSKAPRPAPLKTLQIEILPELPELQGDAPVIRPSFNRSALGWVSTGGAAPLRAVSPENVLIPESEDL